MVVFDLETIPSAWALEAREALWRKEWVGEAEFIRWASLHPALCKIVAVCALTDDGQATNIACRTDAEEAAAIKTLARTIAEHGGDFVTFNGARFDVPVIAHRSMIHYGFVPLFVQAARGQKPWESGPHYDLAQIMRGNGDYHGLQSYAIAYGLADPKGGAVSAVSVWEAWQRGELDAIVEYCAADVVTTFELAKKWKIIGGKKKSPPEQFELA